MRPLFVARPVTVQEVWKPFTMIDSVAIEEIFNLNMNTEEPVRPMLLTKILYLAFVHKR
jgi:hypothetical protein